MKMFQKNKFSILFSCFAAMHITAFAQAQKVDSLQADSLKEVVISQNGLPKTYVTRCVLTQKIQNVPSSPLAVPTVGQELTYQIQAAPSVSITSDAGGYNGYSYIRVRGIDQTRLNISLNGVPIQEGEDQGMYFSNFPDFMQGISNVSIQNGGGVAASGAPNFGASLALETKRLTDVAGGSLYANYGSFNTYRAGAEYNSGIKNKIGIYMRTGYLNSDNYKAYSSNRGYSSMASIGYFGTKDVVKFTALYGNQQNQLAWLGAPLDSIEKNPRYNANSQAEKDNFSQIHTQLQYLHTFTPNLITTLTFYNNHNSGFYTFDYDNFVGAGSDNGAYQYNFNANGTGAILNLKAIFHNLSLNFNVNGNTYSRQHTGTFNPVGDTLYKNTGTKRDVSASFLASYNLKKLNFWAGLQARHSDFSYNGDLDYPKKDWNFLNPNLGIGYKANQYLSFYAKYSLTNREPMRNDLFGGNDNLSINVDSTIGIVLLPEMLQDFELGASFYKNKIAANLNFYYMQFQNEIALNGAFGPTGLPLHISAAQTVRCGAELNLNYAIGDGFSLQNSSSFSVNTIHDGNINSQPVLTPQIIINQGIMYNKNITRHLGWHTAMSLRYQSEAYLDFANTAKLPASYTADIRGGITYKRLDFTMQCRNLLNQRYYSSGSVSYDGKPLYFIQAPLNFIAGMTYHF